MAGAASAPASVVAAPASGLPASDMAAAASVAAASEAPASVGGGGGGGGGLGTQRQRLLLVASQTAYLSESHAPPSGVAPGQARVVGVTVVIVAPPFSTTESSMSTGAPGLTEVFGVQAPTRASAAVRPNTSKRGNGRFIQGSL